MHFITFSLQKITDESENIVFILPKNIFFLPYQIISFCMIFMNFSNLEGLPEKYFNYFHFNKISFGVIPNISAHNNIIINSFQAFQENCNNKNKHLNLFVSTNLLCGSNKDNKLCFQEIKTKFCELILNFYLKVYSNDKIKNPELRETLNTIILLFIRYPLGGYILNSIVLIDLFLKGILIDIDKYFLTQIATQNILKLLETFSLTKLGVKEVKEQYQLLIMKDYAKKNKNLFENLCGKIFSNLNKHMSEFMHEISTAHNALFIPNSNIISSNFSKNDAIRKFINYSISFSEYLVLIEVLIKVNPKIFLDEKNLLFTILLNFLTNISTRLTNESSYKKIKEILTFDTQNNNNNPNNSIRLYAQKTMINDVHKSLCFPIISIISELNDNNAFQEDNIFFNNVSASDLIEFENFKNVLNDVIINIQNDPQSNKIKDINISVDLCKNDSNSDKNIVQYYQSKNILKDKNVFNPIKDVIDKYNETIDYLIEKKKVKAKIKMTDDEWKTKNDNESLCYICYIRDMDTILNPCSHSTIFYKYYFTELYLSFIIKLFLFIPKIFILNRMLQLMPYAIFG